MAQKIMYWLSVVCATLGLLLFIGDISLTDSNRKLLADIGQRKSTIDLFAGLAPLNQNLAERLAEMAVKGNNQAVREMLAQLGITLPASPAPQPAAPEQPAPQAPGKAAPAAKK